MSTELSNLIHNMVLDNPMPAKDLARAIGKPYSTLLREVNPYDGGAKLGADTLLHIMAHTGNVKPLEYMVNKMGYRLEAVNGAVPVVTPGAFQEKPEVLTHTLTCPVCGYRHTYDLNTAPAAADVTERA